MAAYVRLVDGYGNTSTLGIVNSVSDLNSAFKIIEENRDYILDNYYKIKDVIVEEDTVVMHYPIQLFDKVL